MTAVLVTFLARRFRGVTFPASLAALSGHPENYLIITRGRSVVVQALLQAAAHHAGLKGAYHCSYCDFTPDNTIPAAHLAWISLDEEDALRAFAESGTAREAVTLNLFAVRGPIKNVPRFTMPLMEQWSLVFNRAGLHFFFGSAISFPRDAHAEGERTLRLIRLIKVDFARNLKLVRGNPFEPIELQAERILRNPEFQRELSVLSERYHESSVSLQRKARKEFFKIAANPHRAVFASLALLATLIIRRLFSQVRSEGLLPLAEVLKRHTVVLVPMHRSHLDYILVGSELYRSKLNPPLVAAGVNLSFWPAGFLIRSVGGYFVRRNARHNRVHTVLLKRYVSYLLRRGHLQEFFIEGGRSRSGKMLAPKLGILSIMVDVFRRGIRRDIQFVPVGITYESVIEESAFGYENTGRRKPKENLVSLLKARKIFHNNYGEVVLRFGAPISLAQFSAQRPSKEAGHLVADLGMRITHAIRDEISLSLSGLAATALLMAPGYALRRKELEITIADLVTLARATRDEAPHLTASLQRFLNGQHELLDQLTRGSIFQVGSALDEPFYYIPGKRRFSADFYKNATIHVFFLASLLATLECSGRPLTLEQLLLLRKIFESEYLLPEAAQFQNEARLTIARLVRSRILIDSSTGLRFAQRSAGIFCPALILPSIQAQVWLLYHLCHGEAKVGADGLRFFEYDALLAKLLADFRGAGYLRLVSRTEAGARSTVLAALDNVLARDLILIQEDRDKGRVIVIRHDPTEELDLLRSLDMAIRRYMGESCEALPQ